MRVDREFEDESLVRGLETMSEAELRARMQRRVVTREEALEHLWACQEAAKAAGKDKITEEEIQAEIDAYRREERARRQSAKRA